MNLNPLSTNFTKWSNTLKQFVGQLPTKCLSVFDHFVGLALKGLSLISEFRVFGIGFLNIFKYNLLWLLIWLLFWYDYCFKAGTHSYKFFPGIINIYNPTSTMCNFWLLLPKNYFQKGDWELAICLHPIWDFSNIFLIPSLKSLRLVFWQKSLQNSAVMLLCFEDFLFVWESAGLLMSWHLNPIFQYGGRKF